MNVLVADDDPLILHLVRRVLVGSYSVTVSRDGREAWSILKGRDRPRVAVINWQMPGMDGLEICRCVRALPPSPPIHLLLITSFRSAWHIKEGFAAGADDYLAKPFDPEELRARVAVGCRILQLQETLAHRVEELEKAVSNVQHLQGLLPICSWCKRIRNDQNYWQRVETYISEHSGATFTHGICPECYARIRSQATFATSASET
jgi:DNA-binding response OmpR family regulator